MHLQTRKRMHNERYRPSIDLERDRQWPAKTRPSERTEIDTDDTEFYPSRSAVPLAEALTSYNLRAKSFAEQQAVLGLHRLSERDESRSTISGNAISELTNALITDAPPEVAQAIQRDEVAALTSLQTLIAKRLSIVSRGEPAAELNGTHTSEAAADMDDSMNGAA